MAFMCPTEHVFLLCFMWQLYWEIENAQRESVTLPEARGRCLWRNYMTHFMRMKLLIETPVSRGTTVTHEQQCVELALSALARHPCLLRRS